MSFSVPVINNERGPSEARWTTKGMRNCIQAQKLQLQVWISV